MRPVDNAPALYMEEKKLLVIADLHIGIEYELQEKGLFISSKVDKIIGEIKNLIKKLEVEELLILGDMKHTIPSTIKGEKRDIIRFVDELSEVEIYLIPGNHDGNIEKILDGRIKILPSHGVKIDSVAFVHGHRWPHKELMMSEILVVAHTHPSFSMKDKFGYKFYERCWVVSKPDYPTLKKRYKEVRVEKVIVMPAFNPLCGGISVNEEGFIGVVDKIVDKKSAEIFLLDGTFIGKIKQVKN